MKPLIVKLGGSVITDKSKPFTVKRESIRRLARELKTFKGPLIVVHGGGSFGHPLALKYKIADGYKKRSQLIGISLTHRAMERLNAFVIEAFQKVGVPAIAVQPSACVVVNNGRIKSMQLMPIKNMLAMGLVPVLYGDTVSDMNKGISIVSGDQIVTYLAKKLGTSRVVLGVDVEGVYTFSPKKNNRAKFLGKITPQDLDLVASLGSGLKVDVTGGMRNKVLELLDLAKLGIEAQIVNAGRPNVLRQAIHGKRGIGTTISGGHQSGG